MSFDSSNYAPELRAAFVKKVGANRGIPRIWLEGQQAARAGFSPGDKYAVEIAGKTVILKACEDGTRTVSAKRKGEKESPVIDLNSNELLRAFEGMEAVRVVVRRGEIILIPLASELKKQERIERIRDKMARQEPLSMASLSHGGGVLSHAIHAGLTRAGVPVSTAFVNEIREDLVEHAAAANPVIEPHTQLLAMPMQEVAQDESLIEGLSATLAHELLGQGIVYEPFAAVGRRIGEVLQKAADGREQKESAVPARKASRSFGVG